MKNSLSKIIEKAFPELLHPCSNQIQISTTNSQTEKKPSKRLKLFGNKTENEQEEIQKNSI